MKEKKYFILAVLLIVCLTSCFSEFFEETDESIVGIHRQHTTEIEFRNDRNQNNVHAVQVYRNSDRSDFPLTINAGSKTSPVSVDPINSFYYYFTYSLRIGGITIPYELPAKYGMGMGVAHVPRNTLTSIHIPSIFDRMSEHNLAGEVNDPLLTDTYFSVYNGTSTAINFVVNDQALPFYNANVSAPQNPGATNVYRLNPTQFANINNVTTGIRSFGTFQTIPMNTTGQTFQRGYFYILEFTSSGITIQSSRPINIANTQG